MKQDINEIELNGQVYVRKGSVSDTAPSHDGLPLVILRTQSAGVHYGYLKTRTGSEGVLVNARRLWYWDGAASLSQLAVDGVSKPSNCKFTVPVAEITVLGIIEVIPVTAAAKASVDGVKPWKQ